MPGKRVIFLVAAALVFLAACGGFGKVNQGRVIEYDPARGVVTLISEASQQDAGASEHGVLPPVTIQVPDDHGQMGPAPKAGKLISLDTANRKVVLFDTATQSFKTVAYTLVEQRENLYADHPEVKGAGLPKIDRDKKAITVYSPERRQLVTFSVPAEYFELPPDTWVVGDQVRYYYKDPHKALRLMNVTRTGIL